MELDERGVIFRLLLSLFFFLLIDFLNQSKSPIGNGLFGKLSRW